MRCLLEICDTIEYNILILNVDQKNIGWSTIDLMWKKRVKDWFGFAILPKVIEVTF